MAVGTTGIGVGGDILAQAGGVAVGVVSAGSSSAGYTGGQLKAVGCDSLFGVGGDVAVSGGRSDGTGANNSAGGADVRGGRATAAAGGQ